MATPEKQIPTLEEALAALRRDPAQPVHARVDEMEIELRVVEGGQSRPGLGDLIAAAGPWQGETTEELIRIIQEGREESEGAERPDL